MRKQDTFFQHRRGYAPILLKVLDIMASGDNELDTSLPENTIR